MFTCEELCLLQETLQTLLEHLQSERLVVNPQKIPRCSLKVLGVIKSYCPEAVLE